MLNTCKIVVMLSAFVACTPAPKSIASELLQDKLPREPDDPRLSPEKLQKFTERGASGVTTPTKVNGQWIVQRDIQLGKNISGYLSCHSP